MSWPRNLFRDRGLTGQSIEPGRRPCQTLATLIPGIPTPVGRSSQRPASAHGYRGRFRRNVGLGGGHRCNCRRDRTDDRLPPDGFRIGVEPAGQSANHDRRCPACAHPGNSVAGTSGGPASSADRSACPDTCRTACADRHAALTSDPAAAHQRPSATPKPPLRRSCFCRSSHRQIVVLLRRHLDLLVTQHGEGAGQPPPRRARHDHLVDVAALGGHERRQEAVLVFLGTRRDLFGITRSERKMISTAPFAPITAICADGQA